MRPNKACIFVNDNKVVGKYAIKRGVKYQKAIPLKLSNFRRISEQHFEINNVLTSGCSLNIVGFFLKILKYSGLLSFSVSSVSLCIRARFVIRSGVELVLSHEYSLRNREKDRSPSQLVTGKLTQADKSNKSS